MAAKQKRYIVTAPYVTLPTATAQGVAILGYYQGATVPEDVPDDVLKRHLDNGQIEEAKAAEETLAAQAPPGDSGSEG
jgi:hypothetical protein